MVFNKGDYHLVLQEAIDAVKKHEGSVMDVNNTFYVKSATIAHEFSLPLEEVKQDLKELLAQRGIYVV